MKYRKLLAGAIVVILSTSAYSQQTHKDSVRRLESVILKSNTITASAVGFAGAPAATWYSFAYLVKIATKDELLRMSYSKNPVLRLYAYTGLQYKNYDDMALLHKRLASDTATVHVFSGCLISTTTVSETVESGTGQWYSKEQLDRFMISLRKDKKYERELFSAIVNNKPIPRYS